MASINTEERSSFYGGIGRDTIGVEYLFGLSSTETDTYLAYRRTLLDTAVAHVTARIEHIALYEKHRRACKDRRFDFRAD